jgi:spermidine synthase
MGLLISVIGASGIIAQFILVRELLVNFLGNEFTIGVVLGTWLVFEALGGYLARSFKFSLFTYKITILLFSCFLPTTVLITKLLRPLWGMIPGEIFTIPIMTLCALITILPVSFIHGALFTASSEILVKKFNRPPILLLVIYMVLKTWEQFWAVLFLLSS